MPSRQWVQRHPDKGDKDAPILLMAASRPRYFPHGQYVGGLRPLEQVWGRAVPQATAPELSGPAYGGVSACSPDET